MRFARLLFSLLLASVAIGSVAVAQEIPAETAIPVMLSTTLKANSKPGERIEGKVMQDVEIAPGVKLSSGSHVLGHILKATKTAGLGSNLTLQFDQVQDHGTTYALKVGLRALAGMEAVYQAGQPINPSSQYITSDQWTTVQVGGDHVQRSQQRVVTADQILGTATANGAVTAKLTPAAPDAGCPATDGGDRPQALWIFSTSACGLYGFSDMKILKDGRTAPLGQIELHSSKDLLIRGGSGWLLLTVSVTP